MNEPSAPFERFMASFDGPITSKQEWSSFDLDALAQLSGAELVSARDALIGRLEDGVEDPRVVGALLAIGDEPAKAALEAGMGAAPGMTRVTIAHRLARLDQNPRAGAALRSVTEAGAPSIRTAAARAAADVDDPELDAWLLALMRDDPDGVVRTAAKMSIFERNGLSTVPESYGSLFFSMSMSPSQELPGIRRVAVDRLAGWLAQLAQGESVDSLGLTDQPDVDMDRLEGFWALAKADDTAETRRSLAELIAGCNAAEALWASDYLAGLVGRTRATWAAFGLGLIDCEQAALARREAKALGDPSIDAALADAASAT